MSKYMLNLEPLQQVQDTVSTFLVNLGIGQINDTVNFKGIFLSLAFL